MAKQKYTEQEMHQITNYFMNLLIMGWNMQEALELLKDSPFYRTSLKVKVDQLMTELGRLVNNDLSIYFNLNDPILTTMISNAETLVRDLAKRSPGRVDLIIKLMEKYDEAPREFLTLNGIALDSVSGHNNKVDPVE